MEVQDLATRLTTILNRIRTTGPVTRRGPGRPRKYPLGLACACGTGAPVRAKGLCYHCYHRQRAAKH